MNDRDVTLLAFRFVFDLIARYQVGKALAAALEGPMQVRCRGAVVVGKLKWVPPWPKEDSDG